MLGVERARNRRLRVGTDHGFEFRSQGKKSWQETIHSKASCLGFRVEESWFTEVIDFRSIVFGAKMDLCYDLVFVEAALWRPPPVCLFVEIDGKCRPNGVPIRPEAGRGRHKGLYVD